MDAMTREEQAYRYIRKKVLTREILPGEKLSEPAIAKELDFSRTPVRAALRRLDSEGLVVISLNHGAEVAKPSAKDIEDTYMMRESLESLAASLASERVRRADILFLQDLLERENEAFLKGDLGAYVAVNESFHFKIAELSGNENLEKNIKSSFTFTDAFAFQFNPVYNLKEEERSMREHRIIVEALEAKQPRRANYAMKIHIISSMTDLHLDYLEATIRGIESRFI